MSDAQRVERWGRVVMRAASTPGLRRRDYQVLIVIAATPTEQQSARFRAWVQETCYAAHLSNATTWRLIKRGVLRTTKIGRRTLVQDESLQRLIKEGAS